HLVLDRGKPGLVAVNPEGRRFVSEATSYHLFVEAMIGATEACCFLICDDDFIAKYGLGMVRPRRLNLRRAIADGYIIPTLSMNSPEGWRFPRLFWRRPLPDTTDSRKEAWTRISGRAATPTSA